MKRWPVSHLSDRKKEDWIGWRMRMGEIHRRVEQRKIGLEEK